MKNVRITLEYTGDGSPAPVMRWERAAHAPVSSSKSPGSKGIVTPEAATFELLGRAFEVAQREQETPFDAALAAFFRGAMVRKEDVADVLTQME